MYFWLHWTLLTAAAPGPSLVAGRRACSLAAVLGLPIVVASLVEQEP